jgi:murein DD-endopeptidase MepM/ murein hydrolase activator NlpD
MRRFERRRLERVRRVTTLVGFSFALGALADAALSWRLYELEFTPDELVTTSHGPPIANQGADPEPAHDPSEPRPVERPGEGSAPLPAVGTSGAVAHEAAVEELRDRDLTMPVDGVDEDDLRDTFFDARGKRAHEALDIMAPRHTPVRAVEDGVIAKVYNSKGGGGLSLYQFDPTNTYCYYYAHLDRYADGMRDGVKVRRGQVIGYVGSTGNASPDAPHLHFGIFRLTPERRWWKGEPINPYPVLR